jgi:hypothetical protein
MSTTPGEPGSHGRHAHDHLSGAAKATARSVKIKDLYAERSVARAPVAVPGAPDLYEPRRFRYIAASGGTKMSMTMRILLAGAGLLITLVGVIFTLQGVGVIGGSFMSGTTTWAVAGPVIALAGLALVILALRRRGPGFGPR